MKVNSGRDLCNCHKPCAYNISGGLESPNYFRKLDKNGVIVITRNKETSKHTHTKGMCSYFDYIILEFLRNRHWTSHTDTRPGIKYYAHALLDPETSSPMLKLLAVQYGHCENAEATRFLAHACLHAQHKERPRASTGLALSSVTWGNDKFKASISIGGKLAIRTIFIHLSHNIRPESINQANSLALTYLWPQHTQKTHFEFDHRIVVSRTLQGMCRCETDIITTSKLRNGDGSMSAQPEYM